VRFHHGLRVDVAAARDRGALVRPVPTGDAVRANVTVTLAVQGTELLASRPHLELPGVVSVERGIRLLPAGEYPVDPYAGSERPSSPPAASKPWWESTGRVPPPGTISHVSDAPGRTP